MSKKRYLLFNNRDRDRCEQRFAELHGQPPAEVIETRGGVLVGPIPQPETRLVQKGLFS